MRRLSLAIAVAALVGLALSSAGHAASGAPALKTRHGKLGTFLVDGKGRTLYLFQKDKTSKSTCSGALLAHRTAWRGYNAAAACSRRRQAARIACSRELTSSLR